jgi:hypothetical protein
MCVTFHFPLYTPGKIYCNTKFETEFESGEEPILHPEQKNQQLPVLAMFRK